MYFNIPAPEQIYTDLLCAYHFHDAQHHPSETQPVAITKY